MKERDEWLPYYEAVIAGQILTDEEISALHELLKEASRAYYNGDTLIMEDHIYNVLRTELEENYEVSMKDGAPPPSRSGKIAHKTTDLLGSLDNVMNTEELREWVENIETALGEPAKGFLISYKYDGLSVALDLEEKRITAAYSRGQDGYGKDLTSIFGPLSEHMVHKLPLPKKTATLRCECIMLASDFALYRDEYTRRTGETIVDQRTAVASILGKKGGADYAHYLTLVGLDVSGVSSTEERLTTVRSICGYFQHQNGVKVRFRPLENWEAEREDVMNLETFYKECQDARDTVDFLMDGLVIELTDPQQKKALGSTVSSGKHRPRWAIALKYPPATAITKLNKVDLDVAYSASGRITPVAVIEPVTIRGKKYSRVSLSDWGRIERENIQIGQKMTLTVNGDVLAYVRPIHDGNEYKKIIPPVVCPLCGGDVVTYNDGIWLNCANSSCPAKVRGKVYNYLSKMRIKGIAESSLNALFEAGLLNNIQNLYELDLDAVAKLPGFGAKSAQVLEDAVAARLEVYDYEFFGAWNWPTVGRTVMQTIFQTMTWEDFVNGFNTKDRRSFIVWLSNIKGVGRVIAENIFLGMEADNAMIAEVSQGWLTLISSTPGSDSKPMASTSQPLKVVVTGDLHRFDRDQFKTVISNYGHKMVSSISKKVDYLITNTPNSGTVKNKEACKLGIPIITEDQFYEITGI